MSSGDHGDPVSHDTGRDLATDPDDDMTARAAAAVRAFAALGLSGRPDDSAAGGPEAGTAAGAEPPLRPDAVLRGRRFTGGRAPGSDIAPPDLPTEQQRVAEDRRRAERRRLADERRDADRSGPTIGGPAPGSEPDATPAPPPARARDRALLHLMALAVAGTALVAPVAAPVVVATAALAGMTARSVAVHGPAVGPLVARGARRAVGWLRPSSLVWLPVLVARSLIIAVVVPGALWAFEWVVTEGSPGVLVAARAGVWTDGFRAAGAVLCFMLVTGVGDARHRRAALVRRALDAPAAAAPVAGAAACAVVAVLTIVPRVPAGPVTGIDGMRWVPPAARGVVDRVRDRVVLTEVQSVAECLDGRQDIVWQGGYTTRNPIDADDVASLATRSGRPTPEQLATAAVSLHAVLAPWVDTIVIEVGGSPVVEIDRDEARAARPLPDAARLVPAATTGADLLEAGDDVDAAVARRCASGATL